MMSSSQFPKARYTGSKIVGPSTMVHRRNTVQDKAIGRLLDVYVITRAKFIVRLLHSAGDGRAHRLTAESRGAGHSPLDIGLAAELTFDGSDTSPSLASCRVEVSDEPTQRALISRIAYDRGLRESALRV